jgi:hypothetical protein
LIVKEHSTTSGVRKAFRDNTTDYQIGVVSLDVKEDNADLRPTSTSAASTSLARFVRIDGHDPLLMNDGGTWKRDATQRAAVAEGRWPFAFELQAVAKPSAKIKLQVHKDLRDAVTNAVLVSQTEITGLAFLPQSGLTRTASAVPTGFTVGAPKEATVRRSGGNNCAPLVGVTASSTGAN